MLQDRFNIISPRMFNVTNSFQMRNVRALHKLKRLKIISSGVVEPITVPENLSPFVQDVMTKQIEEERKQEILDCVNIAADLVAYIDTEEIRIGKQIQELEKQVLERKSCLKKLKKAKEHGKATSNYLPLAALIVSQEDIRGAGLTPDELEIPKLPKAKAD